MYNSAFSRFYFTLWNRNVLLSRCPSFAFRHSRTSSFPLCFRTSPIQFTTILTFSIIVLISFSFKEFCRKFKYFPVPADSALKILTQAGYLEYTDEQDNASRLYFTVRRDELYKLRELGEDMDRLIQVVLRSYTGVFTDYIFINEDTLAVRSGLTRQRVYDMLMRLSKMHIIHYIPHKKTPYIIYTRERIDIQQLQISRMVYEDRKERYEARIGAMVDYVTTDTVCRSRMLLRYFGEKNEHNCGICDICLSHRAEEVPQEISREELCNKVLQVLAEQSATPAELAEQIAADKELLTGAVRQLLEEERITSVNGILQTERKGRK